MKLNATQSPADLSRQSVRQFLNFIVANFEIISVSPELVSFCQTQLHLTDRSVIEQIIAAVNGWLKSAVPLDALSAQLGTILSTHSPLRDVMLTVLEEEGGQVKAGLASRAEPFLETLLDCRCERLSEKQFQLDLALQSNDPLDAKEGGEEEEGGSASTSRPASLSFLIDEAQLSGLLDDMQRIREQLFRSLQS